MYAKLVLSIAVVGLAMVSTSMAQYQERDSFDMFIGEHPGLGPKLNNYKLAIKLLPEPGKGKEYYNRAIKQLEKNPGDSKGKEVAEKLKVIGDSQIGCSEELLQALGYFIEQSIPYGRSRLEKALQYVTGQKIVTGDCMRIIQEQFQSVIGQVDQSRVAELFKQFDTNQAEYFWDGTNDDLARERYLASGVNAKDKITQVKAVSGNLKQLSAGDERAVCPKELPKSGVGKVSKNVEYAFDRYLVEPCKYYNSIVGKVFDNLYLVKRLWADQYNNQSSLREHVVPLPEDFKKNAYYYKRCWSLINFNDEIKLLLEDFFCGNRSS